MERNRIKWTAAAETFQSFEFRSGKVGTQEVERKHSKHTNGEFRFSTHNAYTLAAIALMINKQLMIVIFHLF